MTLTSIWWKGAERLAALAGRHDRGRVLGPWILGYHRISDAGIDGATSTGRFREHLDLLSDIACVVELETLLELLSAGLAKGDEVAITFDDGYRDQGIAALLATERGLPGTIFVATSFPGSQRGFFWEGRSHEEAERIKSAMRRGAKPPEGLLASDLLDWNEIIDLRRKGIAFASHTRSHRILSGLNDADLHDEFALSVEDLANHGIHSSAIAYPNGDWLDFDERTGPAARQSGLRFGLTAIFGHADRNHLPWRIRRVLVGNESAMELGDLLVFGRMMSRAKSACDGIRRRK